MGFLNLFLVASFPVIKVLLITALGLFLALDGVSILGNDARKIVNQVTTTDYSMPKEKKKIFCFVCNFFHRAVCWKRCSFCDSLGFMCFFRRWWVAIWPNRLPLRVLLSCEYWFLTSVCFVNSTTILWHFLLSFRWFMPVNILATFILGSALGWILIKITRPPKYMEGLILGCCSAGMNSYLWLMIIICLMYPKVRFSTCGLLLPALHLQCIIFVMHCMAELIF